MNNLPAPALTRLLCGQHLTYTHSCTVPNEPPYLSGVAKNNPFETGVTALLIIVENMSEFTLHCTNKNKGYP